MNKVRRMDRLVAMTKILVDHPHQLYSLGYFSTLFDAAKSTVSEDIFAMKQALAQFGLGLLETINGAAGGVRYIPLRSEEQRTQFLTQLAMRLEEPERLIPGGFLYMSDLLFDPHLMAEAGEILAGCFAQVEADCVMTVETKGIPLAMMTARALHLPLVIVRRGSRVTEGSAVSINYVTGSSRRIQTMSIAKRAIKSGWRVLVVDDFMKAGGTARGMIDLAQEVGAEVVGTGVLVSTGQPQEKLVEKYTALLILEHVDEHNKSIVVKPVME